MSEERGLPIDSLEIKELGGRSLVIEGGPHVRDGSVRIVIGQESVLVDRRSLLLAAQYFARDHVVKMPG